MADQIIITDDDEPKPKPAPQVVVVKPEIKTEKKIVTERTVVETRDEDE